MSQRQIEGRASTPVMIGNMTRFGDLIPDANPNDQRDKVLVAGNLKKIGKIVNLKGHYKVIGMTLYKAENRNNRLIPIYDLADYSVSLIRENNYRFQLTPVNNNLRLEPVRFQVATVDERARWFKVLNYLTNETHSRRLTVDKRKVAKLNPHNQYDPEDLQTIEGIQDFLRDQTKLLDNALNVQNEAVSAFMSDVTQLQTSIENNRKQETLLAQVKEVKASTRQMQQ